MHISAEQDQAAGKFVDLIASKLGPGRAVHSETAVASAARLAGSLLFRSFNLSIPSAEPGAAVLSTEANEQGPELISIMSTMLQHFGVSLNQENLGGHPSKRGGSPQLSTVESLASLQEDALRIAKSCGLELKEAAQAAAIATAFIVKECAPAIGPEIAFNIAAYGFIEGCKTIPPPLAGKPPAPAPKKPWYKLW